MFSCTVKETKSVISFIYYLLGYMVLILTEELKNSFFCPYLLINGAVSQKRKENKQIKVVLESFCLI
ncbi:hypothetical protein LguiA_022987 [Lonicera macranthoides]